MMDTARAVTLEALADIQTDINNSLRAEHFYPPEGAVRCPEQKPQELLSWTNIQSVERLGYQAISAALRIGFVENFNHHAEILSDHFYRFEGTRMELETEPTTGTLSWKISSKIISYKMP